MSITKEKSYEEYIAKSGVPFFITFEYERREDLEVTVNNRPVDFVVNDDKVEGFTFNENDVIKIYRNTQPIQPRDFRQGYLSADDIEKAFDKLTMKAQDQDRKIGTSLRIAGDKTKKPLIMDINTVVTVDEFGEFKTIPKSDFKGDSPGFQIDGDKIRFNKPDGTWGEWVTAPRGYSPDFEVSGDSIRFKKPDATWGEWVVSPKGDPPLHEVDNVNGRVRFKKADGAWGEWINSPRGFSPDFEVSGGTIRFKKPDGVWGDWLIAPKGDPPLHELDPANERMRFQQADGSWGSWITVPRGFSPDFEVSGGTVRFKKPDNTWGDWIICPKGDKPNHEVSLDKSQVRFEKPDGTWGDWTLATAGEGIGAFKFYPNERDRKDKGYYPFTGEHENINDLPALYSEVLDAYNHQHPNAPSSGKFYATPRPGSYGSALPTVKFSYKNTTVDTITTFISFHHYSSLWKLIDILKKNPDEAFMFRNSSGVKPTNLVDGNMYYLRQSVTSDVALKVYSTLADANSGSNPINLTGGEVTGFGRFTQEGIKQF